MKFWFIKEIENSSLLPCSLSWVVSQNQLISGKGKNKNPQIVPVIDFATSACLLLPSAVQLLIMFMMRFLFHKSLFFPPLCVALFWLIFYSL